mmetsp:Transcript_25167/g.62329  ORF Transcript_25167/g.62329 Transcript_25167/m.62329 type:complete len:97 (+) Transcript_25167:2884-3174(+)
MKITLNGSSQYSSGSRLSGQVHHAFLSNSICRPSCTQRYWSVSKAVGQVGSRALANQSLVELARRDPSAVRDWVQWSLAQPQVVRKPRLLLESNGG